LETQSFFTIILAILLGIVTYVTRKQEAANKSLEIQLEQVRSSSAEKLEAMEAKTEQAKRESAEAAYQAEQVKSSMAAVSTLAGGITELARSLPSSINKLGQELRTAQNESTAKLVKIFQDNAKALRDYTEEVRSTSSALMTTLDRAITINGQRLDHLEDGLKTEMARVRKEFIELENQVKALPKLDGEAIIKAISDSGDRIIAFLKESRNGETIALPIVQ
jgi:hypothetical protein